MPSIDLGDAAGENPANGMTCFAEMGRYLGFCVKKLVGAFHWLALIHRRRGRNQRNAAPQTTDTAQRLVQRPADCALVGATPVLFLLDCAETAGQTQSKPTPAQMEAGSQGVTKAQANASRTTCTTCHRRKVKCDAHDRGYPCTRCRKSGLADACHVHRKNQRVSRRRHAVPTPAVAATAAAAGPAAAAPQTTIVASGRETGDSDNGGDGSQRGSSSSGSQSALRHGEYTQYLVAFIDEPPLAERPIDKDVRTLYVGSALSNMHFLLQQRTAARRPSSVVHYPTQRIAKPAAPGGGGADGLPLEAVQLPAKPTVDRLLAAYFAHINPGFPVVDEVLFMRQYRARDAQNPPSLLLLQAMLVAGAHALYGGAGADDANAAAAGRAHKATFFRRARMLLDARFERNRDTLVQAALLLTWHADGPEDVAANAWHWVGLAARTATGLGMHRDADASTLVAHNKRMWRRVWWLLVQCDVLVALQYGRPPALRLDDADVRPLTPADFQDCGPHTRVDYVLHATALCRLLAADILRVQFRPAAAAAGPDPAVLHRTDEALANWFLQLPPSLQLGSDGAHLSASSSSAGIDVWAASLHLTYNTALILLHRLTPAPAPAAGSSEDGTAASRGDEDAEICTSAAVAVQQIFEAVCASGQVACLWSWAINCLFTALIQLSAEVRRRRSSAGGRRGSPLGNGNPLLAVAALHQYHSALRQYHSALASLRQLAAYWPNAQAVVQFFEQSVRLQGGGRAANGADDAAPTLQAAENAENMHANASALAAGHVALDGSALPAGPAVGRPGSLDTGRLPSVLPLAHGTHHLAAPAWSGSPGPPFLDVGDPWSSGDWQRILWQPPESTDDFLFSF